MYMHMYMCMYLFQNFHRSVAFMPCAHVPPERMDDSDWDSLLHIEEKFLADGYREGVCACVVRMRVCFQANS
jgi:hypothetical protein